MLVANFLFALVQSSAHVQSSAMITHDSTLIAPRRSLNPWRQTVNQDCKFLLDNIAPALRWNARADGIGENCCSQSHAFLKCKRPMFSTTRYISSLDLSRHHLTGIIPEDISKLSRLESLTLFDNQLTGTIPSTLGSLTLLTDLVLSSNRLEGSIPIELGNLSRLKVLALRENQLSGQIPTALGQLKSLQCLFLDNNKLSGEIPTILTRLTKLWILFLQENRFTNLPREIYNFHELGSLQVLEFLPQNVPSITTAHPSQTLILSKNVDDVCAICLEDMETGQTVVKGMQCAHHYHKECVDQSWRRTGRGTSMRCPQCRNPFLM